MDVDDLEGPEFELAQLLAEGFSARHIAVKLDPSERVAAGRIRVVFAKLGVSDRRELRAKMDADQRRRDLDVIRHDRRPDGRSDG